MSVIGMPPVEAHQRVSLLPGSSVAVAPFARASDDAVAERRVMGFALAIEARDPYTIGHCHRLARYAAMLGRRLGFTEGEMATLQLGAFLHDVGKVGIPDAVLLKPKALTPAEQGLMQQHTVIGDFLCRPLASLVRVREVIRHHHERLDGSGYPDRLRGDEIPVMAQVVAIVDLFDAVTTSRPYKPARSQSAAIECLRHEVDRGWKRQDLVEEFVLALEARARLVKRLKRDAA
jgi:putative two-component system response regulator